MGKLRTVQLTDEQRKELEHGYRSGTSHAFRSRCQMILLKSQGKTSIDIASILDCCEVVVNTWLNRWQSQGINGLRTKPGQGRKRTFSVKDDAEKVKQIVSEHRQQLKLARVKIQEVLQKEFCETTLKRFLKNLTDAGDAFAVAQARGQTQRPSPTK